jgi:hypothetical protein
MEEMTRREDSRTREEIEMEREAWSQTLEVLHRQGEEIMRLTELRAGEEGVEETNRKMESLDRDIRRLEELEGRQR